MNALLCRIGADQSVEGGSWNGLVDASTGKFVYVAIPESRQVFAGLEKPYTALAPLISQFGAELPPHLLSRHMHLDPDFEHLTYGDQGERAKQLRAKLKPGDLLVFYASLADLVAGKLVYAIIGVYVVDDCILATELEPTLRHTNAHGRRLLQADAQDLVVRGRPGVSGKLERCLPIGDFREKAYRVNPDILEAWGGLSVKNGYLQRSARLPLFLDPLRFQRWFASQNPVLTAANY